MKKIIQAFDVRKHICIAGFVLFIMLMLSACGGGGADTVQPAENGRQVLINTDDISVAAVDYQTDTLNRKTVQFEVANHTDQTVSFYITSAKLDGKDIHYNYRIGNVEGSIETDILWKLFAIDLYDYDKDLFPSLKSLEISISIKDDDNKEIASVNNVSLDFRHLGSEKVT